MCFRILLSFVCCLSSSAHQMRARRKKHKLKEILLYGENKMWRVTEKQNTFPAQYVDLKFKQEDLESFWSN